MTVAILQVPPATKLHALLKRVKLQNFCRGSLVTAIKILLLNTYETAVRSGIEFSEKLISVIKLQDEETYKSLAVQFVRKKKPRSHLGALRIAATEFLERYSMCALCVNLRKENKHQAMTECRLHDTTPVRTTISKSSNIAKNSIFRLPYVKMCWPDLRKIYLQVDREGATVAEQLACWHPTKAIRAQSPAGLLRLFANVGIVPDDAVGWQVFSGVSRFPRPFIPALILTHLDHPHRLSTPRFYKQLIKAGVAEQLACSHPTKVNRVQSPAGSLPDFRMWESYGTMPLVGGFSRGYPVSPPFHSAITPYSPRSLSSALKTSLLRAAQISSLDHKQLSRVKNESSDHKDNSDIKCSTTKNFSEKNIHLGPDGNRTNCPPNVIRAWPRMIDYAVKMSVKAEDSLYVRCWITELRERALCLIGYCTLLNIHYWVGCRLIIGFQVLIGEGSSNILLARDAILLACASGVRRVSGGFPFAFFSTLCLDKGCERTATEYFERSC
ncbi:hypothetical protein PR048_014169 [Dryococelus australis]|uniref:Uncharacterized protein n=1 Tax=Dryococelus australis TaxID=614101 RepID=A0ABQ9HDL1_9NEOP|nr:hypothetical protein PR048_014169 [Dryococelus australis]